MADPGDHSTASGAAAQARRMLAVLFAVNTANFFDRQIISAVAEPLRVEWSLTDTQLGLLATSFTLLYAFVGLPLGRLADLTRRTRLLSVGVAVWSALTALSAFCTGFWTLFAARLGVGLGEATCAPAATSMIGDLFPSERRARAMSIFMLGLPLGIALSYSVSGTVARHYGWRAAFLVAGLPGMALALALVWTREPQRGAADGGTSPHAGGNRTPWRALASIPTLWWIVLSGAIHNFNLYALSSFLPAYLGRYHHADVQMAGIITGIVIGVVGGAGLLAAGWIGDRLSNRLRSARMLLSSIAILVSVPLSFLALEQPPGAVAGFVLFQGLAYFFMYTYYSLVYAAIQDVVPPALRGSAMAAYFFAMYLLGASLGPVLTGWLSDRFALLAEPAASAEAARAAGLHGAMAIIPVLAVALAVVLYAGSKTLPRDAARMRSRPV